MSWGGLYHKVAWPDGPGYTPAHHFHTTLREGHSAFSSTRPGVQRCLGPGTFLQAEIKNVSQSTPECQGPAASLLAQWAKSGRQKCLGPASP